jgi:hypothetical protein
MDVWDDVQVDGKEIRMTLTSVPYGNGKLSALEAPRSLRSVTDTVPGTAPPMERGSRSTLRLPNFVSPANQFPKTDATFSVILLPDTEQPVVEPQLSVTGLAVWKSSINCVIVRDVENDVINAANPLALEVWMA